MIVSLYKDSSLLTTGIIICRNCAVGKFSSLPDSTSILNDSVHLDVLVYDKDPHLAVAKGFFKATREEIGHQFPFDKSIDLDSTTRAGTDYNALSYANEILESVYPLPGIPAQHANLVKEMIAGLDSVDPIKIAHIMRLNKKFDMNYEIPPPNFHWSSMKYFFNAIYRELMDFAPSMMSEGGIYSLFMKKPKASEHLIGASIRPAMLPFLQKYAKLLSIQYGLFKAYYPSDKGTFPGFPSNFHRTYEQQRKSDVFFFERVRDLDQITDLAQLTKSASWMSSAVPKEYPQIGTMAKMMPLITEPQPEMVKPYIDTMLEHLNLRLQQEVFSPEDDYRINYTISKQQYNKKGEEIFRVEFALKTPAINSLYIWNGTMQWITRARDGSPVKDLFPLFWFFLSFVSDVEFDEASHVFNLICAKSPKLIYPQKIKENMGTWGRLLWDEKQTEDLWNILVHFNERECLDYSSGTRFRPPGPKGEELKGSSAASTLPMNHQASYLINSQYLPCKASENIGWKPPFTEFTKQHLNGSNVSVLMTAFTDVMIPRLVRFLKIFTPMPTMLETTLHLNIIKRILQAQLYKDEKTEAILWHYLYHQTNIAQTLRFGSDLAWEVTHGNGGAEHPLKSKTREPYRLWYYINKPNVAPEKRDNLNGTDLDLVDRLGQHDVEIQIPLFIMSAFVFCELYTHTDTTARRAAKYEYANAAPFLDFNSGLWKKNQHNFYQLLSVLGAIDHMRYLEKASKQKPEG
jgi:hypothetical protein